jgi:ligand-binding SRPBCC domain-containing protein
VTSGLIGLGEEVTWQARHFGVPFRMTSRIADLDAPNRFVDEQVRGPFARFRHEHTFTPQSNGSTMMIDQVAFEAPFGPIGRLSERVLLARHLEHLIRDRAEFLKNRAESR